MYIKKRVGEMIYSPFDAKLKCHTLDKHCVIIGSIVVNFLSHQQYCKTEYKLRLVSNDSNTYQTCPLHSNYR